MGKVGKSRCNGLRFPCILRCQTLSLLGTTYRAFSMSFHLVFYKSRSFLLPASTLLRMYVRTLLQRAYPFCILGLDVIERT
jgi:hypothetical protein